MIQQRLFDLSRPLIQITVPSLNLKFVVSEYSTYFTLLLSRALINFPLPHTLSNSFKFDKSNLSFLPSSKSVFRQFQDNLCLFYGESSLSHPYIIPLQNNFIAHAFLVSILTCLLVRTFFFFLENLLTLGYFVFNLCRAAEI